MSRAVSPAATACRSKHVLFRIASQTRAPPSDAVELGDETRSGRVCYRNAAEAGHVPAPEDKLNSAFGLSSGFSAGGA